MDQSKKRIDDETSQ